MAAYLIRRLAQSLLILLGVSFITFVLLYILPAAAIVNTALYDYCPELVEACVKRGDELVGHGHTNSERQSDFSEAEERKLLASCRDRIKRKSGQIPAGWLSPWISETAA